VYIKAQQTRDDDRCIQVKGVSDGPI